MWFKKGMSFSTWLVVAAMVSLLALAACGGDDNPSDTGGSGDVKSGGTLLVGMVAQHGTFDAPLVVQLPDIVTVQELYDPLVFLAPDQSIQPALATSWETNDDATEWTFNLRKGVKFHHGKEFKAEDVIYTFTRLYEVESPLISVLPKPLAIVAVDDHTVRFEFELPNAVLLQALNKYHALIMPSDVDPARFVAEEFGTGPFILVEHVIGERTSFIKNEDYWWDGHPRVDEVQFIFLSSPEARAEALKAGTVDMIYDLDTASVPTLKADSQTSVAQAASGGYMNLAFDLNVAPFDDILVRKALQAVTDRNAILQGAQFGLGGIAYDHPITEDNPVFNSSCKPPDYNPALARDLLAQAGYPNGIDLTLFTSTAGGAMVEMATVFKETAAAGGININIKVAPEETYWSEVWLVEPFFTVWWGGRPPWEAFAAVYPSTTPWQESKVSAPKFEALLDRAMTEGDLESQAKTFGELQCLAVDQVHRIIPVFRPALLGVRHDVREAVPMFDNTMSLHRTWLDRD
jgi:peptide/nickel transport system substrate-binding protein